MSLKNALPIDQLFTVIYHRYCHVWNSMVYSSVRSKFRHIIRLILGRISLSCGVLD